MMTSAVARVAAAVVSPFLRVAAGTPARVAVAVAALRDVPFVVVLGPPDGDTLLGVASVFDLARGAPGSETAGDLVLVSGAVLSPALPAREALTLMRRVGARALPVATDGEIAGVVTRAALHRLLGRGAGQRTWAHGARRSDGPRP
jgi:CBS domain-containing protein